MIVGFARRTVRRAGLFVLILGLACILAACSNSQDQAAPAPSPSPELASPAPEATPEPDDPALSGETESAEEPAPTVEVYWPEQIEIPSIQVKAPVVQVGLEEDGSMEAPKGPDVVGWYNGGVAPGVEGNALLTAHVDWLDRSTGKAQEAVFWNLHKLKKGDPIIIHSEENKTFTYTVTDSITIGFDDPDALNYLQPTDEPILTVITCEGDFDQEARNYDKRRIVVAELQPS